MSTYTRLLYHIVFAKKNRVPALASEHRREFLAYAVGVVRGMNCFVHRINCVEEHLHLLAAIPSSMDVASLVKDLKISTGEWLRNHGGFPEFRYWQEGYGAFTESWCRRDVLIEYIKNQEEHHRVVNFLEEYRRLVEEAGVCWNQDYLP